ncbi:putative ankyrin repeat domain-containing protein [Phytophthora infestans]|uniref:Putative ankyrin repeat domain-containing protein n=1 Tax=Phytophthora infestans TaxID=4787 RepID=A0A8S9V4Z1_PHYIN|nr:putative ankyrin repeat domain-containing protein [Phytophthora infestans]
MAVHNAAIAGHEDIVRVIPDNMMDMNIPTFHTKETLAHLAVKNGHKDLFNILRAFGLQIGADLRIKDGKGQSVSDVAIDREWAREIAALTAEYFAKISGEARRSDAILPPQITPRTVHRSTLAAEYVGSHETGAHEGKEQQNEGQIQQEMAPPNEE